MLSWAMRTRFADIPGIAATTQAAIGIGAAATFLVMIFRVHVDRMPGVILAVVAFATAVAALLAILRQRPRHWLVLQPLAYALGLLALLGFIQPDSDNRRSAKPFARQV